MLRCSAILLAVLAASPFTRPFYTFELTDLLADRPCALCSIDSSTSMLDVPSGPRETADPLNLAQFPQVDRLRRIIRLRPTPVMPPKRSDMRGREASEFVFMIHSESLFQPSPAGLNLRL